MSTAVARGSTAVMARRVEPPDSLDYFPTPPWATRALFADIFPCLPLDRAWPEFVRSAWEPACGEGHMSAVIEEFCAPVIATDIFDYSGGDRARLAPGWFRAQDFLDERAETPAVDWIITNPPFQTSVDFTLRALDLAHEGVAMLVRTQWIEGVGRYARLFRDQPPFIFAPFVERVPMVKGRWDPQASTATSYAWFVWLKHRRGIFRTELIPPCRRALTKPDDVRRFALRAAPTATEAML